MQGINHSVITGNLTRDPKLHTTESGAKVCNLRVAVNGRRKDADGDYVDTVNYFNVSAWGASGEACAKNLKKGRAVAVDGRLDWQEQGEGDDHREYVQIVASTVQFLGGKPQGQAETATASADGAEDDIPF